MLEGKKQYQYSEIEVPELSLKDRLLHYLHDRDLQYGRAGCTTTQAEADREIFFEFSTSFVHSRELAILSILRWKELDDLRGDDVPDDLRVKLPAGYIAIANVGACVKRKFAGTLKTLIMDGELRGFTASMRALEGGFGGRTTPLLCLWKTSEPVKEIIALSLTTRGFLKAQEQSEKSAWLLPWQINPLIVLDAEFASFMQQSPKGESL
jgi:hypothetical protein